MQCPVLSCAFNKFRGRSVARKCTFYSNSGVIWRIRQKHCPVSNVYFDDKKQKIHLDKLKKMKYFKGRKKIAHGYDFRYRKNKKATTGNQTPGTTKARNCVCGPLDKFLAKHNRSYKHPLYQTWKKKANVINRFD